MESIKKPELLAPAGDMERFDYAIQYGADAVYLGGINFGMRTAPGNFTFDELRSAVTKAHNKNIKVYLVCNTLPRNNEIDILPEFLREAESCGVDALIISDVGVFSYAKKYAPNTEIHMSTQTGIVNYATANAFYEMGAKRIVTARELSLKDIKDIRDKIPNDMSIECFVHGAMCVSFSGRCLLSNYLTGRDSNRGDCAQPCRWKYAIMEETRPNEYFPIHEEDNGTYIMNSRDMCMINHIPELIDAGVSSFKIEGRAKSAYYTAVITNAYRCAIDEYMKNPSKDFVPSQWIIDEVTKISYREYCTGFYFGHPNQNAEIFYDGGYKRSWDIAAIAEGTENNILTVSQRNRFFEGDELEVIEPGKPPFKIKVENLYDEYDNKIECAPHPMMTVKMKIDREIPKNSILRKEK